MTLKNVTRFVIEFALAVAVSTAAYRVGYGALTGDSDWAMALGMAGVVGILILVPLMYVLPYGAAGLIFLIGLFKRRLGLILGPLAFGLGLFVLSGQQAEVNTASLEQAVAEARAADQRSFAAIEGRHDIIAVDGETWCRAACRQILTQTSYGYVTNGFMYDTWHIYRRAEGDTCLTAENRLSHLEFLEAGYVGLCATREKWELTGDYLLVSQQDHYDDRNMPDSMPRVAGRNFIGDIFEAHERRNGADRLLGRWIAGTVYEPRNQFDPLAKRKWEKVGADFDAETFLSALLHMPISSARVTGPASNEQLLDALLPLTDDAEHSRQARNLIIETTRRMSAEEKGRTFGRIEQLLSDGNRMHLVVGFDMMMALRDSPELGFAKPYLLKALASGDAELVNEALGTIYAFPRNDRVFAKDATIALAFSQVLREPHGRLAYTLFEHLNDMDAPFPADLRARARERITGAEPLTSGEMAAALLIVGRKHDGPHEALFDFVQSLQGENFETTIKVIGGYGWRDIEGGEINRWSPEEIEVLVARAAHVPNERLKAYVDAFRFQAYGGEAKQDLVEEVEGRLDALRTDPAADQDMIKKLERLREIIPGNIAG